MKQVSTFSRGFEEHSITFVSKTDQINSSEFQASRISRIHNFSGTLQNASSRLLLCFYTLFQTKFSSYKIQFSDIFSHLRVQFLYCRCFCGSFYSINSLQIVPLHTRNCSCFTFFMISAMFGDGGFVLRVKVSFSALQLRRVFFQVFLVCAFCIKLPIYISVVRLILLPASFIHSFNSLHFHSRAEKIGTPQHWFRCVSVSQPPNFEIGF